MALDETGIMSWLHFGDLHITDEHAENYRDFLALIDHANTHVAGAVNFAVLPGDNAEKGTEEQYRLVRRAVDRLVIPLFVISGDHDVHTGNLDLFRRYLEPNPVRALTAGEYRLIFLDAVDHAAEVGKPGAFGLRDQQLAWLTRELAAATREKRRALLFNHVYPSELGAMLWGIDQVTPWPVVPGSPCLIYTTPIWSHLFMTDPDGIDARRSKLPIRRAAKSVRNSQSQPSGTPNDFSRRMGQRIE